MGKYSHPNIPIFGLDYVRQHTSRVVLCQGQPKAFEQAVSLAPAGCGLGDYSLVPEQVGINDLGNGVCLVVPGRAGIEVSAQGNLNHLALVNDEARELLFVTSITNAANVSPAHKVDLPSWEITIASP